MSDDIEFEDVVDFESDEEELQNEVKNLTRLSETKLPAKSLKEDSVNKHEEAVYVKKNHAPISNGFAEHDDEKTTNKAPTPEEGQPRMNGKSVSDSLSLLTDDDEITRILNTKYSRKTKPESDESEKVGEVQLTNGFGGDVEAEESMLQKIVGEKSGIEILNEDPTLLEFESQQKKTKEKEKTSDKVQNEISSHEEVSSSSMRSDISKLKSSSPVGPDKKENKDATTGRIEMTRNYLKALTPDEGLKGAVERDATESKVAEKNAIFEIGKRSEESVEFPLKDSTEAKKIDKQVDELDGGGMDDDVDESVDDILNSEDPAVLKRRQSMDDFIKKILAEAREDRLKESGDDDDGAVAVMLKGSEENGGENEKEISDIVKETDILLEKILSSKADRKVEDKKFEKGNAEVEDYENYLKKEKTQKDEDQTNDDKFELKTSRNRHRIALKERDEAEDEIEKILSSKKYEPANKSKKSQEGDCKEGKENGGMDGDANDDFRDFLNKFKKDRQKMFGQERNNDRDSEVTAETQEYIKDRTQGIRAVISQQANICENVKSVSKQLDELERELREVRQATLKRKSRLEALENAVNAERKQYEFEHNSAVERSRNKKPIQKYTQEVKNQLTASLMNKRQSKAGAPSDDMDDIMMLLSSTKRRGGSVCSVANLMEDHDSYLSGNSYNVSNDRHKYRSMSKDRDLKGTWNFDRKEGSLAREGPRGSYAERSNFEHLFTGQSSLLSQSKPRSRASIATMDMANSSADDFLNKIRSKYSFLGSKEASRNHTDITQSLAIDNPRGGVFEKMSYAGIKHMNAPTPLNHYNHSSITTAPSPPDSLLTYGAGQSRRALSVADNRGGIHYDRSIGGYTAFPSRSQISTPSISHVSTRSRDAVYSRAEPKHSSGGGEFKSRFLDKVRERKASNIEHTPGASQLADRVMAKLHKEQPAASPVTDAAKEITNGD